METVIGPNKQDIDLPNRAVGPRRDGRADKEGERVRLRDGEQADIVASRRDNSKSVIISRKGIDIGSTGQNSV